MALSALPVRYTLRGWKFNFRWIGLWIGFFWSDWQAIWISPEGGAGKHNRKTFTAKRLRSFEFGFVLFEAFDTTVSAASQNTNQFSKSSQSIGEFSAVQSIIIDFYILLCGLFTSFIRINYALAGPSMKNQCSAAFYISCKNLCLNRWLHVDKTVFLIYYYRIFPLTARI